MGKKKREEEEGGGKIRETEKDSNKIRRLSKNQETHFFFFFLWFFRKRHDKRMQRNQEGRGMRSEMNELLLESGECSSWREKKTNERSPQNLISFVSIYASICKMDSPEWGEGPETTNKYRRTSCIQKDLKWSANNRSIRLLLISSRFDSSLSTGNQRLRGEVLVINYSGSRTRREEMETEETHSCIEEWRQWREHL